MLIDWSNIWLFPVAILIAVCANSSGFSGGVLFQPIFYFFLNLPLQNSIATGIATETVGMTSGSVRYMMQKDSDLNIGFLMVMLTIPGIVIGNHALQVLNGDFLKLILGFGLVFIIGVQLYTVYKKKYGVRKFIPAEEIYPVMWVPPLGGFFSAATGTGMAELSQPLLERRLGMLTLKANATAILIEAIGDWVITILNLQAGLIRWDIWFFTGTGVIIGGQLGAYVSKYLPVALIKTVFSLSVAAIAIFYIFKGLGWLFS